MTDMGKDEMTDIDPGRIRNLDNHLPGMTVAIRAMCPVCHQKRSGTCTPLLDKLFRHTVATTDDGLYLVTCSQHSLADLFSQLHRRMP